LPIEARRLSREITSRYQGEKGRLKQDGTMKIKVENEMIVKAVKKLYGVEMVVENVDDAKEALSLILKKKTMFEGDPFSNLQDLRVSSITEYKTSAVNYRMVFLLEFVFQDHVSADVKVAFIKELQEFFNKV
jgi:hypothetical protein